MKCSDFYSFKTFFVYKIINKSTKTFDHLLYIHLSQNIILQCHTGVGRASCMLAHVGSHTDTLTYQRWVTRTDLRGIVCHVFPGTVGDDIAILEVTHDPQDLFHSPILKVIQFPYCVFCSLD